MSERRITKINDAIKSCLSEIIRDDIRDPRVRNSIVSITKVKTSSDLSYCTVYVSVFNKKNSDIIPVLNSASGLFRKLTAQYLNLRVTPEFKFIIDDSVTYGAEIDELLKKINPDSNSDSK